MYPDELTCYDVNVRPAQAAAAEIRIARDLVGTETSPSEPWTPLILLTSLASWQL